MAEFKVGQTVRVLHKVVNASDTTMSEGKESVLRSADWLGAVIEISDLAPFPYRVQFGSNIDDFDYFTANELEPADPPAADDELYDANSVEGGMVENIDNEIRAGNPEYTPDAETIIRMANRLDTLETFVTDIAALNVDVLSPIDALTKLYELQRQARGIVKGGE